MEGYIGEIRMFGGTFAPRGWMFCQGQQLSISNYETIYTIIGTTYGGDGVNTFNLPALGGRVPIGTGQRPGSSAYVLGQVQGTESVTLLTANMPSHNHTPTVTVNTTAATATATLKAATTAGSTTPAGSYLGADGVVYFYATAGTLTPLAPATISVTGFTGPAATVTVAVAGSSLPHSNIQPYTALNYIICVEGIFPSRN